VASHSLTLSLTLAHTPTHSPALARWHTCVLHSSFYHGLPADIHSAGRPEIHQLPDEEWSVIAFKLFGIQTSKGIHFYTFACANWCDRLTNLVAKKKSLEHKIDVDWCKTGDASGFRFKGKALSLTKVKFVGVTSYERQLLLLLLELRGKERQFASQIVFLKEIEIMSHQFVTTGYKLVISLLRIPLYT